MSCLVYRLKKFNLSLEGKTCTGRMKIYADQNVELLFRKDASYPQGSNFDNYLTIDRIPGK